MRGQPSALGDMSSRQVVAEWQAGCPLWPWEGWAAAGGWGGGAEAGSASKLGGGSEALLEEVAAGLALKGAPVCQAKAVGGWGGRQCFEVCTAWRPKGGACLGNRNKSNHAASKKASGSPGGVFWPGGEQGWAGCSWDAGQVWEPWWIILGVGRLGLGDVGVRHTETLLWHWACPA